MALSRAVLASAALLLLLCLSPAPAAAENTVPAWNNCGGSQFCACGTYNCDQQWPGHTCQPSEACVRKDQTWWRCEPRQNGEAAAGLHAMQGLHLQGGTVLRPSLTALLPTLAPDEAVSSMSCNNTVLCAAADPTHHAVCSKTVDTWAACGGGSKDAPWDKTCCKHGDVCSRKDAGWWRCEPAGTYYDGNGALPAHNTAWP